MKETEGTWLDFDGNYFGQGAGSKFVVAEGRFQSWNAETGEPRGDLFGEPNEDYVVMYIDNYGSFNGRWNDHYSTHAAPLICQKPATGMDFITATAKKKI